MSRLQFGQILNLSAGSYYLYEALETCNKCWLSFLLWQQQAGAMSWEEETELQNSNDIILITKEFPNVARLSNSFKNKFLFLLDFINLSWNLFNIQAHDGWDHEMISFIPHKSNTVTEKSLHTPLYIDFFHINFYIFFPIIFRLNFFF